MHHCLRDCGQPGGPVKVEEQISLPGNVEHTAWIDHVSVRIDAASEALVGNDLSTVAGVDDRLKPGRQALLAQQVDKPGAVRLRDKRAEWSCLHEVVEGRWPVSIENHRLCVGQFRVTEVC